MERYRGHHLIDDTMQNLLDLEGKGYVSPKYKYFGIVAGSGWFINTQSSLISTFEKPVIYMRHRYFVQVLR
jgi:hypothetical protein